MDTAAICCVDSVGTRPRLRRGGSGDSLWANKLDEAGGQLTGHLTGGLVLKAVAPREAVCTTRAAEAGPLFSSASSVVGSACPGRQVCRRVCEQDGKPIRTGLCRRKLHRAKALATASALGASPHKPCTSWHTPWIIAQCPEVDRAHHACITRARTPPRKQAHLRDAPCARWSSAMCDTPGITGRFRDGGRLLLRARPARSLEPPVAARAAREAPTAHRAPWACGATPGPQASPSWTRAWPGSCREGGARRSRPCWCELTVARGRVKGLGRWRGAWAASRERPRA
jgi:hypothetical protein